MRRTTARSCLAGVLALLAGACGSQPAGPPEIALDRTACDRCSMLVSDPEFAVAYLAPGDAAPKIFDDVACLLAELADDPARSGARLWFQDAEGSGWLEEPRAVLVHRPGNLSPMGSGVIAFGDRAAAERSVAEQGGEIVALADLRPPMRPGMAP